MKKIVTILSIRPDFIRMSPLIKKLDNYEEFEHIIIHTGQHYDEILYGEYLKELELRNPDYNFDLGRKCKTHYEFVAKLSIKLCELIKKINPDCVIFLGDSHSVLASISLKKEGYDKFKICHIEAGMRCWSKYKMPEEINRICCDTSSDILMPYNKNYANNLIKEGIDKKNIHIIGNTIYEPVLKFMPNSSIEKKKNYIIGDIHRFRNLENLITYENNLDFLEYLGNFYKLPVLLLKFPRMENITNRIIKEKKYKYLMFLENNSNLYKNFLEYQYHAKFIMSDSGTGQEEPVFLNTPAIILRSYSERPESINEGWSILIGEMEDRKLFSKKLEKIINFVDHFNNNDKDMSWLLPEDSSKKTSDIVIDILREKIK